MVTTVKVTIETTAEDDCGKKVKDEVPPDIDVSIRMPGRRAPGVRREPPGDEKRATEEKRIPPGG